MSTSDRMQLQSRFSSSHAEINPHRQLLFPSSKQSHLFVRRPLTYRATTRKRTPGWVRREAVTLPLTYRETQSWGLWLVQQAAEQQEGLFRGKRRARGIPRDGGIHTRQQRPRQAQERTRNRFHTFNACCGTSLLIYAVSEVNLNNFIGLKMCLMPCRSAGNRW